MSKNNKRLILTGVFLSVALAFFILAQLPLIKAGVGGSYLDKDC